jgi:hypothetical protein
VARPHGLTPGRRACGIFDRQQRPLELTMNLAPLDAGVDELLRHFDRRQIRTFGDLRAGPRSDHRNMPFVMGL